MTTESQRVIDDVATTLDALLSVRYRNESDRPQREALLIGYIRNEVVKLKPVAAASSLSEVMATAATLPLEAVESLRSHCLFYGCDDLIDVLVQKRIRSDAIAREEAVLYVQDRLQRDDFRRIRSFSADRGATFVTYIWQVINNLLLDFLRAQGKKPRRVGSEQESNADDVVGHDSLLHAETDAVTEAEAGQLREMLAQLMTGGAGALGELNPIRDKLRQTLKLSSKDKVFLKAMFQYDLSISEIRALPGFEMSVNEAYRFYYRIMEQLIEGFKRAGVLDSLRAEIGSMTPRVAVQMDGREVTLVATDILYFEDQTRNSCHCALAREGQVRAGVIETGFSKLGKQLAAYFTEVNSSTAIADGVLSKCDWSHEGVLTIPGTTKECRLSKRLWNALKERSNGKTVSNVRITKDERS